MPVKRLDIPLIALLVVFTTATLATLIFLDPAWTEAVLTIAAWAAAFAAFVLLGTGWTRGSAIAASFVVLAIVLGNIIGG